MHTTFLVRPEDFRRQRRAHTAKVSDADDGLDLGAGGRHGAGGLQPGQARRCAPADDIGTRAGQSRHDGLRRASACSSPSSARVLRACFSGPSPARRAPRPIGRRRKPGHARGAPAHARPARLTGGRRSPAVAGRHRTAARLRTTGGGSPGGCRRCARSQASSAPGAEPHIRRKRSPSGVRRPLPCNAGAHDDIVKHRSGSVKCELWSGQLSLWH